MKIALLIVLGFFALMLLSLILAYLDLYQKYESLKEEIETLKKLELWN